MKQRRIYMTMKCIGEIFCVRIDLLINRNLINMQLPQKNKDARTGNNLNLTSDEWLATFGKKLYRPFIKPSKEKVKLIKSLLSKKDYQEAQLLIEPILTAYYRNQVKLKKRPGQDRKLRTDLKTLIHKRLNKAFPNYKSLKALTKKYLSEHVKLLYELANQPDLNNLHAQYGEVIFVGDIPPSVFIAPFETYEVQNINIDHKLTFLDSFALPDIGHFVNNFRFDDDDTSWPISYNPSAFCIDQAAVGIQYTMTATGFLKISAIVQNLYNKITLAVKDNFGFSSAYLDVIQNLYIDVIHDGDRKRFSCNLVTEGLVSHGVDLSHTVPSMDNAVPYTVDFTTDFAFEKGSTLQILVGSYVYINSDLDDMESFVNLVHWWKLVKLSVTEF